MVARIYRPSAVATQHAGAPETWVLEFKPEAARTIDPLMGWTSSSDMTSQVRLEFGTRAAAQDYARRHGVDAIVEEPAETTVVKRPMGYAGNFAFKRRVPWSH